MKSTKNIKWNPKVRWYDWIVAVFVADLLLTLIIAVMVTQSFFMSFLFGLLIFASWDFWNEFYCKKFRLKQEFERFTKELNEDFNRYKDLK